MKAIGLGAAIAALMGLAVVGDVNAAETYRWTGFYLGGNAGGSWGRSDTDLTLTTPMHGGLTETPIGSTSEHINGVLGGLQVGYSWKISSPVILGLESDIQITGQRGESQLSDTVLVNNACLAPCTPPPPTPVTGTFDVMQRLPWFGTVRGRLGYLPAERWLVYATGGLAYGEVKTDANFSVPPSGGGACIAPCTPPPPVPTTAGGSFTQNKIGWVIGAGIETALQDNWTAKFEYLHIDLGDTNVAFASQLAPPFFGTFNANSRIIDDLVRFGLNYRFRSAVAVK